MSVQIPITPARIPVRTPKAAGMEPQQAPPADPAKPAAADPAGSEIPVEADGRHIQQANPITEEAAPGSEPATAHGLLSPEELEEFLDHIEHCSSCYDELETYFIVHEAIQQLDEKEDGTVLDFRELLEQDIRRSRRYIRQKRWLHFFSVIFFMAVVIVAASFVVFLVMEVTHFL